MVSSLKAGGVIQKLGGLPSERAQGVCIEPEPDWRGVSVRGCGLRRAHSRGGKRARESLQKGTAMHAATVSQTVAGGGQNAPQ